MLNAFAYEVLESTTTVSPGVEGTIIEEHTEVYSPSTNSDELSVSDAQNSK